MHGTTIVRALSRAVRSNHHQIIVNRLLQRRSHFHDKNQPAMDLSSHLRSTNEDDCIKCYGDEKDVRKMSNLFPVLVDELAADENAFWLPEIADRFKTVIMYNIPDNKKIRALLFIETYKALMAKRNINDEDLKRMYLMAWCTEIHQTAYVMVDDILDNSRVRRHRPAWQVVTEERDGKTELSYNDCYVLYESVFLLLKKYFSDRSYYRSVLESYHTATMNCLLGLTLDTMMHKQIEQFNEHTYFSIAPNKTAHPMFILNVLLAFQMAELYNEETWPEIQDIVAQIGIYHQIRNDYQGYVDNIKRGKPEEDIQLGQCTWFIVQALKQANPEQKTILKKHYGFPNVENVSKIVDIYEQLNLQSQYEAFSKRNYRVLHERIEKLPDELVRNAVFKALQVTYGFAEQTFEKLPTL